MSIEITVQGGTSKKLLTGGKYCPEDIVVTAESSGSSDELVQLVAGRITEINNSEISRIRMRAFFGLDTLESVNFPSATYIGDYAFDGCMALSSVTVPAVTDVSEGAFQVCENLTTLDVPKVAYIGSHVFGGSALRTLILRSQSMVVALTYVNDSPCSGCPIGDGAGYIYVPKSLLEAYQTDTLYGWSAHAEQLRALEDYTVDGTIDGELDPEKVGDVGGVSVTVYLYDLDTERPEETDVVLTIPSRETMWVEFIDSDANRNGRFSYDENGYVIFMGTHVVINPLDLQPVLMNFPVLLIDAPVVYVANREQLGV